MYLARGYGLDTCPQESWARMHRIVGEFVAMPPEQMLDFKRRELRRLKDGEDIERGGNMERIRNEVQSFKEQVDALATHLARREEELKRLQREIENV